MIIGKVNAVPPESCVYTMAVGATGYVHINEIIITEKVIFLDMYATVIEEGDDDYELNNISFLPIKRRGLGLTQKDFDLDFTGSHYSNLVFNGRAMYLNLMKEKQLYIVFSDFEIGQNNTGEEAQEDEAGEEGEEEESLKSLKDRLGLALKKQDYTEAACIRDKIAAKEENNTPT